MRYFIHLGFDGSSYSGWQQQKNTPDTVQEVMEQTLARVLKKNVTIYGCGRTDAGVHASQYVAHIDGENEIDFDLKFRLNKNLPDDIAVFEVITTDEDWHSRYDATARTYDYFIHWKKDPALIRYSAFYDDLNLNFDLMKMATRMILKTEDFRPLCKQPDLYKHTRCKVTKSELFVNEEEGRMRYSITSNRFLRGMVRFCVSFLLKVGSGEMTLKDFEDILNQKKELRQKEPALANGLFLSKVEYPYLNLKSSHQLFNLLIRGLE